MSKRRELRTAEAEWRANPLARSVVRREKKAFPWAGVLSTLAAIFVVADLISRLV